MTLGPSISRWLMRVIPLLILLYALWWLSNVEESLLALIKILMESLLPQLLSTVSSVAHAVGGGWKITTTVHPVAEPSVVVALTIAPVFLNKCIVWAPAALALVLASAPKKPKIIGLASLLVFIAAVALTLICVAAHLAVTINRTPAMLDDGLLPPPPDFRLNAIPYPLWYFHLITFANYLVILVAPLAMPVIVWFAACNKQIRAMLGTTK